MVTGEYRNDLLALLVWIASGSLVGFGSLAWYFVRAVLRRMDRMEQLAQDEVSLRADQDRMIRDILHSLEKRLVVVETRTDMAEVVKSLLIAKPWSQEEFSRGERERELRELRER